MNFYVKTTVNPNIISPLLTYYLNMYKNDLIIPLKLENYLKNNYNISCKKVIELFIKYIKVNSYKKDIIKINIFDVKVNETRLNTLIQLMEFGNLELPKSELFSTLLKMSINAVKRRLGGI